ncbi:MAG: 30S ribosomal protein S8e [Candidatus Heimdallarchaeota archaeon LC_2]|nr:MAG: 30S ribosomal protein S8e [Candidatus Heimdallarchaeota archaeon LC_2]
MTQYQGRSGRTISGGRLRQSSEKKKRELGRPAAETSIAEERKRSVRTHGGNQKIRLLRANKVNVMDVSTGKAKQVEIQDVDTNPASRQYSRRRIITKGAILKTDLGLVKVTNRPGIEGLVNGIILAEE